MTLFQRICRVLLGALALAVLPLAAIAASVHLLLGVGVLLALAGAMVWLYRRIPPPIAASRADATPPAEPPWVDPAAVNETGLDSSRSVESAALSGAVVNEAGAGVAVARGLSAEAATAVPAAPPSPPTASPVGPAEPPQIVGAMRAAGEDVDPAAARSVVATAPPVATVGVPASRLASAAPPRSPAFSDDALVLPRAVLWRAAAIVAAFALIAGLRLYRLDTLQGEWYGDISTVYEYVMSVRQLQFPHDLYNLGVGPLYPMLLSPVLRVLGDRYLSFKLAAVLFSLSGLVVLFFFARRLRGTWFAVVAMLVAGTGSWLLIYSRLGDVQAAVPLFTIAPLALAIRVTDSQRPRPWSAALSGLMAGACIYLYGAAFMVPVLVTLVLATCLFPVERRSAKRRDLAIYASSLAVAVLPMAIASILAPQAFAQGHFAVRFVRGPGIVSTVAGNFVTALMAYVTRGDIGYRGNSPEMPHIDVLTLVLAILGSVYWLRSRTGSRRWATILIGGFLLMHLPSILVARIEVPSAGRSIAAAPFLYLLAASGIWWIAGAVTARRGSRAGVATACALLIAVAAWNAHRYFVRYIGTLPYANTHIARAITSYVNLLPTGTAVYMVGPPWSPGGMPEPKSIRYTIRPPSERFFELPIEDLDCTRLAGLLRPAVLIWSYQTKLPSPGIAGCADELLPQLFTSARELPIFHAAPIGLDRAGAYTSPSLPPPPPPPSAPAPPPAAPPESPASAVASITALVTVDGLAAELRHPPIDMGGPELMFDGNPGTVMRGASDNPFTIELRFLAPARIAEVDLDLGYMPEFDVALTVTSPEGAETTVRDHQQPASGTAPHSALVLAKPIQAATARITIEDIRRVPAEGWHIHIFELQVRRDAAAAAHR